MYKIYINETPLILISSAEIEKGIYPRENVLITPYVGKKKFLLQYIDNLEKSSRHDALVIHYADVKILYKDFISLFEVIDAGGGLVTNPENEILFIYRRKHWDLPKGKLDPKENFKTAALREVKEECGLEDLSMLEKLITTYHVFKKSNGSRALKLTKWYHMTSTDDRLIPQIEEEIEEAQWRNLGEFLSSGDVSYENIFDVLLTFFKLTK